MARIFTEPKPFWVMNWRLTDRMASREVTEVFMEKLLS